MSDLPQQDEASPRFRPLAEVLHALMFLTRLPIPFSRTMDLPPLAQSMRMFSVAGGLVGAALGLLLAGLHALHLPDLLAAVLASAAYLIVTGALHEDGLADAADGFGGGKSQERRLEIMRDSRIGSYGTLALVTAFGARVSAFAALLALPLSGIVIVLAASQAFSRAMMVDLMWATRPARSDGVSASVGRPSRSVAAFAILAGLVITLAAGLVTSPENSVAALALALATTAVLRRMAVRLIGGQTGDVCGAVQVASEVMMLAAFAARIG